MAQVEDKTWARDRDLIQSLVSTVDENGRPYSRNKIAKETGLTKYRIDKICKAEGIKFDRSNPGLEAMRLAVEADARVVRAVVSQKVLAEIESVFKRMHSKHKVVGWFQGMAFEHTIDEPTSGDLKNYATIIGILIDKHLVLERYGTEDGEVDGSLAKVQTATEVARIMKAHPDMPVEDVINEVMNR
ncbi:helix-turn-helix DNA binding domain protein [Microbacterium phage Theresita]|nr:helix-turn-helix DNA binding domain protein [Microbacterium phage Theresita]